MDSHTSLSREDFSVIANARVAFLRDRARAARALYEYEARMASIGPEAYATIPNCESPFIGSASAFFRSSEQARVTEEDARASEAEYRSVQNLFRRKFESIKDMSHPDWHMMGCSLCCKTHSQCHCSSRFEVVSHEGEHVMLPMFWGGPSASEALLHRLRDQYVEIGDTSKWRVVHMTNYVACRDRDTPLLLSDADSQGSVDLITISKSSDDDNNNSFSSTRSDSYLSSEDEGPPMITGSPDVIRACYLRNTRPTRASIEGDPTETQSV